MRPHLPLESQGLRVWRLVVQTVSGLWSWSATPYFWVACCVYSTRILLVIRMRLSSTTTRGFRHGLQRTQSLRARRVNEESRGIGQRSCRVQILVRGSDDAAEPATSVSRDTGVWRPLLLATMGWHLLLLLATPGYLHGAVTTASSAARWLDFRRPPPRLSGSFWGPKYR